MFLLPKSVPFPERTNKDWLALRESRQTAVIEKKKRKTEKKKKPKTMLDAAMKFMTPEQVQALSGIRGEPNGVLDFSNGRDGS